MATGLAGLCSLSRRAWRHRAVKVLVVSTLGLITAWSIPAAQHAVLSPLSHLDAIVPQFEFQEVHRIVIPAPADRVDQALRAVTAHEISLFQFLTTIRRMGRSGPESILNAPESQPLLEVATRTTFILLYDEPGCEIVFGSFVMAPPGTGKPSLEGYTAQDGSGLAKATMNFLLEKGSRGSTVLTTETRVHATDPATRRRFAAYWRVILPGSALIRLSWLKAISRRTLAP